MHRPLTQPLYQSWNLGERVVRYRGIEASRVYGAAMWTAQNDSQLAHSKSGTTLCRSQCSTFWFSARKPIVFQRRTLASIWTNLIIVNVAGWSVPAVVVVVDVFLCVVNFGVWNKNTHKKITKKPLKWNLRLGHTRYAEHQTPPFDGKPWKQHQNAASKFSFLFRRHHIVFGWFCYATRPLLPATLSKSFLFAKEKKNGGGGEGGGEEDFWYFLAGKYIFILALQKAEKKMKENFFLERGSSACVWAVSMSMCFDDGWIQFRYFILLRRRSFRALNWLAVT